MPRKKSPDRERAFEMWRGTGGKKPLKEIANELGVSPSQVRNWKAKDAWGKVAQRNANDCAIKPAKTSKTKPTPSAKKPESESAKLTDKQAFFILEYLIDFNATRAAIAAGYSKDTAYSIGWENLRKPEIQAEIQKRTDDMVTTLGVTQQRVILEYLKIAFADITNYVEFGEKEVPVMDMLGPVKDEDGNVLMKTVNYVSFKESVEIDGTLVSEVRQGSGGVSIKLHDKMKALEALTRYLDLLPDNHKRRIEEEKLKLKREDAEWRKKLEEEKAFF